MATTSYAQSQTSLATAAANGDESTSGHESHSRRPSTFRSHESATTLAPAAATGALSYSGGGVVPLTVDGADANDQGGAVTFADPSRSSSTAPLYHFDAPRRAKDVFGVEAIDVLLTDLVHNNLIYTVRLERDFKTFSVLEPGDEAGSSARTLKIKNKALSGTYRVEFDAPGETNQKWTWKGNVFSSLELSCKDAKGKKTTLAVYLRTSTRTHVMRLYPALLSSSGSSSSSSSSSSSPSIAMSIATLYPFLAIYRKHLDKDYTSDRVVGMRSTEAAPSAWDSRLLGDLPKDADPLRRASAQNDDDGDDDDDDGSERGSDEHLAKVEEEPQAEAAGLLQPVVPSSASNSASASSGQASGSGTAAGKGNGNEDGPESKHRWKNPIAMLRRGS